MSRHRTGQPSLPDPLDAAAAFWRWLRRMRTALYLLGVLAAAVFVGTVVPQRPNVGDTVERWLDGREGPGETVAGLLDALGFFDVFGSAWFIVLVALLFTSLTACLIPRYRAYWRMWRRGRPPRSRNLGAHPEVGRFQTTAGVAEAAAAAREVLGARRYRLRPDDTDTPGVAVASDMRGVVVPAPAHPGEEAAYPRQEAAHGPSVPEGATGAPEARRERSAPRGTEETGAAGDTGQEPAQVAGEKGHLLREGGSLLFHSAFYLLLVGVIIGELTGFVGQVGVVEGDGFADTPIAYWTRDEGRWWSGDDHREFELTLNDFDVSWTDEGQPVGFRSDVTIDPHGDRTAYDATTFVNVPLVVDDMKIHQLDWGYATRIVVRDEGEVVWDEWVLMNATTANVWRGAVKAPAADPQLGLDTNLIPTALEEDGQLRITGWPDADAPLLVFTAWVGDLRLDRVQNVNELDTTALRELTDGALRPGQSTVLPTGASVEFAELRRWVGFQVSRRPTAPVLLVAGGLLLAGLLPALYAYRRRIWVEAAPDGSGGRTVVSVAGHAFQRQPTFTDEHRAVVDELRQRLGGESRPADAPGGEPRRPSEVVRR